VSLFFLKAIVIYKSYVMLFVIIFVFSFIFFILLDGFAVYFLYNLHNEPGLGLDLGLAG